MSYFGSFQTSVSLRLQTLFKIPEEPVLKYIILEAGVTEALEQGLNWKHMNEGDD